MINDAHDKSLHVEMVSYHKTRTCVCAWHTSTRRSTRCICARRGRSAVDDVCASLSGYRATLSASVARPKKQSRMQEQR